MARAAELVAGFDYRGHPSVFQTSEQTRTSDDYFLESGDRISYFFEKDAFGADGEFKRDIFHSLKKWDMRCMTLIRFLTISRVRRR